MSISYFIVINHCYLKFILENVGQFTKLMLSQSFCPMINHWSESQ